jgi:hypothetical protein
VPNAERDRDASLRAAIADAVIAGDDERAKTLQALLMPKPKLRLVGP